MNRGLITLHRQYPPRGTGWSPSSSPQGDTTDGAPRDEQTWLVPLFSSQEGPVASEPLTKGPAARVVRPFSTLQLPGAPPAGRKAEHRRYP